MDGSTRRRIISDLAKCQAKHAARKYLERVFADQIAEELNGESDEELEFLLKLRLNRTLEDYHD